MPLLDASVLLSPDVGVAALDCSGAVALDEACFAASAFFFASRARRLRSASLLPEATRPGFFSVTGFVFGGSAVTRAEGVACAGAVVSSGIVSSGCVAIVYIVV